jgi:hypothetical protein
LFVVQTQAKDAGTDVQSGYEQSAGEKSQILRCGF